MDASETQGDSKLVKHGGLAGAAARVQAAASQQPVVVTPSTKAPRPTRTPSGERAPIEIELPRGVVRFHGAIERAVLREPIEAPSLRRSVCRTASPHRHGRGLGRGPPPSALPATE